MINLPNRKFSQNLVSFLNNLSYTTSQNIPQQFFSYSHTYFYIYWRLDKSILIHLIAETKLLPRENEYTKTDIPGSPILVDRCIWNYASLSDNGISTDTLAR
jgi:hypothetical protein